MSEIDRIQAALEQARQNITQVRHEMEGSAPPCRQCKYWLAEYGSAKCGHPAVAEMFFYPQTGDIIVSRPRLSVVRCAEGICGSAGRLFESSPARLRVKRFIKLVLWPWALPVLSMSCGALMIILAARH